MGKRLSKIYTRTGDDGSTGLGDGSRISKDAPRTEAMGDVDELNAQVGMLRAGIPAKDELQALLADTQHDLFDLGAELSLPGGGGRVRPEHSSRLEKIMDSWNKNLPPLDNFILPGGSEAVARCHLARTVCRRAERRVVALDGGGSQGSEAQRYLNRLSDFLFVLARVIGQRDGEREVLWEEHRGSAGYASGADKDSAER